MCGLRFSFGAVGGGEFETKIFDIFFGFKDKESRTSSTMSFRDLIGYFKWIRCWLEWREWRLSQAFEVLVKFPATIEYKGRGVYVEVECIDLEKEGGWRMRMGLRLSDMVQVSSANGKTVLSKLSPDLAVEVFDDISIDFTMRGNQIVLLEE